MKRYMAVWFRHLAADRLALRYPGLRQQPFVLVARERGRVVIRAVSREAGRLGILPGTVLADVRAVYPDLLFYEEDPSQEKLLASLAVWCDRFTPITGVDGPDGLILDISGCTHLWGGEETYFENIVTRLQSGGYHVRAAIADTMAAAWAVARYGSTHPVIAQGGQAAVMRYLPPEALRLEPAVVDRLRKLGLTQIGLFMDMPPAVLRRRFGLQVQECLGKVLGHLPELLVPVQPPVPYLERLPCFDPIRTAPGIELAIRQLLAMICQRLQQEEKGLRKARLVCYRTDGQQQQIAIGTNSPVRNQEHLFRLFELKIETIEPDLGIELFVLEAPVVEGLTTQQERLWDLDTCGKKEAVTKLLDRLENRLGAAAIHRYLPEEHHWPERSIRQTTDIQEAAAVAWPEYPMRPVSLLGAPVRIEVSVPIPDYPPILFIHKGNIHKVVKADGPERIEREWWIEKGLQRDYYQVEDEAGGRYWLFRSGHYGEHKPEWFIHGYFA
ncbi:Y-family DNA polymerase [Chitinophaga nivalis]|uniref:DNA polymerase Y family protein n=1 Tax=Chitinophaga nivalis TaxID=2991709 RepID=A0ABT3IN20_9BACT|nr:DNA polymerase Y family protein [Chitinophaga nivalis]MCW3464941.1 DNA polymerase Y family protein [Chitinophaga nivalis]MCW3485367.1 DNA polymerase Y family protein [Chitinophaga nivalis]